MLKKPCNSWLEFVSPKIAKNALKLDLLANFRKYVRQYFSNPKINMVKGIPFVASNISSINETVESQYYSNLLDPLDVSGYANKILLEFINRRGINKYLILSTINRFNHEVLFDEL